MIPLLSHTSRFKWMKRTLPTSSNNRGVAKSAYSDNGYTFLCTYVDASSESKQLHGISDGSLVTAFGMGNEGIAVGDRLVNTKTKEVFEVISAMRHETTEGTTLKMRVIG